VDIKHAAREKEIHCISKSLFPEKNLNYVALSCRWSHPYQEILVVDTGLGYSCRVTRLDLENFYQLCSLIMQEPDLQHMEYVWVDAICVDHHHIENRKETFYHMTSIFGYANFVLAIPDFHHQHRLLQDNKATIYHLLHGNTNALEENSNTTVSTFQYVMQTTTDWVDCVSVISQCSMAKRKNKFKFWFMIFDNDENQDPISFFHFDLISPEQPQLALVPPPIWDQYIIMYNDFYTTMTYHLKRKQSFLEMILKYKSSHNGKYPPNRNVFF
jgi:hypothetical protein